MAMITFFMSPAYRLKRSYVTDRASQSLSAGKYEVTAERKAGRTERERQNKNKVDLNHQVIPRVLCDISGWKIFFFFEYVPSCKMSQLETLSQRDIKSVDTSRQNIWHESFYERFTISLLPLTSFLFYPLTAYCFSEAESQYGRSDFVVLLPQVVCRFSVKTVEMKRVSG